MKLLGNSGYGKTINKINHCDTIYADDHEALKEVKEPQFRQLNPLMENIVKCKWLTKPSNMTCHFT